MIKSDFGAGFFSLEDYKSPTREIFKKYLKASKEKDLAEFIDFYTIQKETLDLYAQLNPDDLPRMETEVLVEKIKSLFMLFFKCQAVTLFSEALDESLIKEFYKKIKGPADNFDSFFETSSLLTFKSFASRNDEALLGFDSKKAYDIQWVLANYSMTIPLDAAIQEIKKIISEKGGRKSIIADMQKLDKQIKSNKEEAKKLRSSLRGDVRKLFDFNQFCMYMRDIRKDDILKTITALSNCLRELFPRLGLKTDDIIYAFYPDFANNIYKEKNYKNIIGKRKKGFIVYYDKDGMISEYGNGNSLLRELYAVMDKSFSSDAKNIIKGNIGCGGVVQAKVNIILDQKDFPKFKQGDVLVTSMTRPEFVPLMKKSSAVITDEGGITCHAAIVSRELNIPCIIGTKNATRVLKDGDFVEVDANNGVVKIIKHNK
jgi:phosphohistidine swiveling domain-containing protein